MNSSHMDAHPLSAFRLLSLALLKSYQVTVFAMMMLCFALIVGALGLSAVLGLQQINQPSSADTLWFEPQAYYQIQVRADQPLTPDSIARLSAQVPFSVVAYVSDSLEISNRRIDVLALDSLAVLSGRPFLNLTDTDTGALAQANLFGQSILLSPLTLDAAGDALRERLFANTNVDLVSSDAVGDNLLVMDLGVWSSAQAQWSLSGAFILTTNDQDIAEIRTALPDDLRMIEPTEQFSATQLSNSFQLNLLAMGLLMFAVCLFIVINATNLLLHKRLHMFRVLRQLGFNRNTIVWCLFMEMTLIVMACAIVGTLIGYQLVRWLTQELDAVIFIDLQLAPTLMTTLVIVFGIAWVGVVCACTPFFMTLRDSLATTSRRTESRQQSALLLSAIALTGLSLLCFIMFSTLWIKLFATACLILGLSILMLWLLPHALSVLSRRSHKRSYITTLLLQSALALTRQTRLAFCAFFIAITSNMAMNIMVDSFRGATEQWLQQRLASEAYVYVETVDVTAFYRATGLPAEQLTPRFVSRQRLNDTQVQVFSYPTTPEFQKAMLFSEALADVWQRFSVSSTKAVNDVLVNQQFAYANDLGLGNVFEMRDPVSSQPIAVTIAGVFYDYGNPRGQILLPVEHFMGQSVEADLFAVNGLSLQAIESALGAADIDFEHYPSEDLIALSMQEFDNTFVITDALNVVTLLVAALSLACTVSVLLDNTRAERFLFRSLGFSSRWLLGGNLIQYGTLLVVACLLAIPAGTVVAWVLIHQINFAAFFWTYPLSIQLSSILPVVLMSVSIVLITIYLPLRITAKNSVSEELSWLD